jgi:cytochrome P450
MVLQESLRLYPPTWIMERRVLTDDALAGYHIPAGSTVVVSPYLTHRHPAFWANPEGFDPERFTPEQVALRDRYAYLPFGAGPRQCIGSHFAMMEAQLIVAMVLQKYRLELVPGFRAELKPEITLRTRHGLQMTLHPRGSSS